MQASTEAVRARTAMRLLAVSAIADALSRAGIRWAALKGMDLAFRAYASPSERDMSDVDILVDPTRFEAAVAALCPLAPLPFALSEPPRAASRNVSGFEPDWDEAEHHRRLRFRLAGASVSVEVHRDLFDRPHGLSIDVPALLARAEEVALPDGTRLPVLAPADAWAHVAGHLAWSDIGGIEARRGLADLAALERACALTPDLCLATARAWRVDVAIAEVLAAISAAGVDLPSEAARTLASRAHGGGPRRRLARRVVRARVRRAIARIPFATSEPAKPASRDADGSRLAPLARPERELQPAAAVRALLAPSIFSMCAILWTGWRRRSTRAGRIARARA